VVGTDRSIARRLGSWVAGALLWGALGPATPAAESGTDAERRAALADLARGAAAEAASTFARLLAADPGDAAALEGRVRALLRLDRWREALEEARVHSVHNDDDPRVRAALGEALFRAGRFEEIERALAPAEGPALGGRGLATLGRLRAAEGRVDEAVALMARAVSAAPDDRDVLYWSTGATATRAEAAGRYRAYLERSEGDDPARIEAARGGLHVMEALGERPTWVSLERPARVEVPLTRVWDPATGATLGFVAHVALGDGPKPVPLLLDSGSPGLFVIQRVARKRGFQPMAEHVAFGGGASGRHRVTRGFFPTVTIGDLRFGEALAITHRQELDPFGRYHGLIGLAAFHGYRVTLDFKDDRMRLERSDERIEGHPCWTVDGQLLVRVTLPGAAPGPFLFDTGATRTLVDTGLARTVAGARFGPAEPLWGFGGRVADARRLDGVALAWGGLASADAGLLAADLSMRSRVGGVEVSGLLGLDLLDGRQLVLDTLRQRLLVRP
jgi:tetratricopeptide (TPR) repeat protein